MAENMLKNIRKVSRTAFCVLSYIVLAAALASCSDAPGKRLLEVSIPNHSWERAGGGRLWYTLRWTSGNGIETLHMNQGQRTQTIAVPVGETVLIAAYPLGDMAPLGSAVTPAHESPEVSLNQSDGVLVNELLSLDRSMTRNINYDLLLKEARGKMDDMRRIGKIPLLRDLQNGQLASTSIKTANVFRVDSLTLPDGLWTSEYLRDPSLCVTGNQSPPIELPEGVYRYLNPDLGRVLVLIVDADGDHYSYLRQSLI